MGGEGALADESDRLRIREARLYRLAQLERQEHLCPRS